MKKLFSVLIALIVLCLMSSPAFAADGKVTYNGNAQQFIFEPGSEHSPSDLFPDFKSVMPGDSLTQKITVKNDADKSVKVKIYLRALGAHEDSEDFLSKLHLSVRKSDDNEMAYMFDAAASETAQLTDRVCLGTLYSGGTVVLEVSLGVPTDLDNEYQNKIGYLDWEFMIEEFPAEEGDPKPPQTGDNSQLGLWIAVLAVCLSLFIILLIWRKKTEKNN